MLFFFFLLVCKDSKQYNVLLLTLITFWHFSHLSKKVLICSFKQDFPCRTAYPGRDQGFLCSLIPAGVRSPPLCRVVMEKEHIFLGPRQGFLQAAGHLSSEEGAEEQDTCAFSPEVWWGSLQVAAVSRSGEKTVSKSLCLL